MKLLLALTLFTSFSSALLANDVPVLSCVGTEPFWGASTDASGVLTFSSPALEEPKTYATTALINADGTSGDFAFQIKAQDEANNTLKLNIVKSNCNDGMSDEVYTYTALVDLEDGLLMGCCK